MKERTKQKLKKTALAGTVVGVGGLTAAGGAAVVYAQWPEIKKFLLKKLDERNDRVRPAIQAAKDRKAALAAEQKKLKKAEKKLDKKIKKARQKQATRVYDEYQAKGYEPTAEMIHEAALSDIELRNDIEVKRAALREKSEERVEKAVEKTQAKREKQAAAHAEKKQIELKNGNAVRVSSTVRPEDVQ